MPNQVDESEKHLNTQRRELDAMTDKLIANLQQMINEQTARAAKLATHQPSLSAQAKVVLPRAASALASATVPAPKLPQFPAAPQFPATPQLPPVPPSYSAPPSYGSEDNQQIEHESSENEARPAPWFGKQILGKPQKKQEEEKNGLISTIIFIIIAFLLIRCMS